MALYAAALLSAGSAILLCTLRTAKDHAAALLRQQAVYGAIATAALAVATIPVRTWFLTGGSIADALDPELLMLVRESPLGTAAELRLLGAGLMLALLFDGVVPRLVGLVGALCLCAAFAFVGHASVSPVHAGLIVVHTAAVAGWLAVFWPLARMARWRPRAARPMADEFGRKAIVLVGALMLAGTALLILLVGNPVAASRTDYGELITFKLASVSVLLLLAAWNRMRLTPALARPEGRVAATQLQGTIGLEIRAAALVLFFTSVATTVTSP